MHERERGERGESWLVASMRKNDAFVSHWLFNSPLPVHHESSHYQQALSSQVLSRPARERWPKSRGNGVWPRPALSARPRASSEASRGGGCT